MSAIRAKILSLEEENIKMLQALPSLSLDKDSIKKMIDKFQNDVNQEIAAALQEIRAKRNVVANAEKIDHCRKKEAELLKIDNTLKPFLIVTKMIESVLKILLNEDQMKEIEKLRPVLPEDLIRKMIKNGELLAIFENDSKFFQLLFEQSVMIFKLYNQKPEARELIKPSTRLLNTKNFEKEVGHLLTGLVALDVPLQYICLLDAVKTRFLEDPSAEDDDKTQIVRHLIFNGEATKLIKNINNLISLNQNLSLNFKYEPMRGKLQDETKETKVEAPVASALSVAMPSSESKPSSNLHSMWRRSQSSHSAVSHLSSEPQMKKRKFGS